MASLKLNGSTSPGLAFETCRGSRCSTASSSCSLSVKQPQQAPTKLNVPLSCDRGFRPSLSLIPARHCAKDGPQLNLPGLP